MKTVKELSWCRMNDKSVLMIGDEYKGAPLIMCKYDVLLCSRSTFQKYKNELIPKHILKNGWKPNVKLI